MYFYQKNFIYDISSYPKSKDTTNNSLVISNIAISDLNYYFTTFSRPKILLSTGNFSPWGANDVLTADDWIIGFNSSTNTYNLTLNISNIDITNYDINLIKYLIFLDDFYYLEISSNDPNFQKLLLKNNTILRVKFNNNTSQDFYLPQNTALTKTSTALYIKSNHYYDIRSVNFSTNALQEIIFYSNFPHFINFKIQRPSNTTAKVLRLQLIIVDSNNTSNIIQTYYFTIVAGTIYHTISLIPLYSTIFYALNSNSVFKLNLAWTSDGNTLTTENTTVEIQYSYFLPTNNLILNF